MNIGQDLRQNKKNSPITGQGEVLFKSGYNYNFQTNQNIICVILLKEMHNEEHKAYLVIKGELTVWTTWT